MSADSSHLPQALSGAGPNQTTFSLYVCVYRIFNATCVERNTTFAVGGGWSIPLGGGHDGCLQPLRLCVTTLREKEKEIVEQFVFRQ